MPFAERAQGGSADFGSRKSRLKEVVMGLHWDPPKAGAPGKPADLDALCVLFDTHDRVLEVVHPGQLRSVDGSVIHTGDSRTGMNTWDDERIFVFLEALPETVSKLAFVVSSVTGEPFDAVPGAFCHVSERVSEREWARVELTALLGRTAHTAAILRRGESGWKIVAGAEALEAPVLSDLLRRVAGAK